MRRSKVLLLSLAITGLLAGCTSKTPSPDSYTLTFDANGGDLAEGTGATQQVASGGKAQKPADPIIRSGSGLTSGSVFAGWTKTRNGEDIFDFANEAVTSDRTLYAKWLPLNITFNPEGGTFIFNGGGSIGSISGGRINRPPDPTRPGYTFLGWTTTQNGNDYFDFNAPITTARLILYAKWQAGSAPAATYAVTFDGNGGVLATGTGTTQQIASGSLATQPTAAPTRARDGQWDFAFVYWSADKRTRFDFTTPVTQTTTLYALWSVAIPDTNFRNKLKTIVSSAFDGDRLVVSHASVIGLASMDASASNISNLSGIEFFTALTLLACYENQLSMLDVRQNTALTLLNCHNNQLTALDVTQNTALLTLICGENLLNALDVRQNTVLTLLNCYNNRLTALDVTQNTALLTLICGENLLNALDVRQNTVLTLLNCYDNYLTTLDVTQNTALTNLACNVNQLTTLDVTRNTGLTVLACGGNQLATLDLSRNTALTELYCASNQLTALDMRGMRSVSVSALALGNNPNLISLKVHSNLKDNSIVYGVKTNRGNALTIEVSDAPAGSTNYTKTCSSYQPGNGSNGMCTTP